MDCCRASDTLPCEERDEDEGLGDGCLTRDDDAVAVAAEVVELGFSSDAVDRFAVDFSNLLNCFCILNDTFAGNLEVDAVGGEALEAPLASIIVLLMLPLFDSFGSWPSDESNVGGGGVFGRLKSISILDTSIIGGLGGAGGGPGSSI